MPRRSTRRRAARAAPRRRSYFRRRSSGGGRRRSGFKAENVARAVAAVSGAALLLVEPIRQAKDHYDLNNKNFMGAVARGSQELIQQGPGVYFRAMLPSIVAEAAVATKRGVSRVISNIARM